MELLRQKTLSSALGLCALSGSERHAGNQVKTTLPQNKQTVTGEL